MAMPCSTGLVLKLVAAMPTDHAAGISSHQQEIDLPRPGCEIHVIRAASTGGTGERGTGEGVYALPSQKRQYFCVSNPSRHVKPRRVPGN